MKLILLVVAALFCINAVLAQGQFVLVGKTNLLKQGSAVLYADTLMSGRIKNDTVEISNHSFRFKGVVDYPEECRISILGIHHVTEPFFITSGNQSIIIDSSKESHDVMDFGTGVNLNGSRAQNEYVTNYLPCFSQVNRLRAANFAAWDQCDGLNNPERQKKCMLDFELMRIRLKCMRDSILLDYSSRQSGSEIIAWLLNDAIQFNGFDQSYRYVFEKIKVGLPLKIRLHLQAVLDKSQSTAVGSAFPLTVFINEQLGNNFTGNNKYTLVDFWFSKCRPCISQFNQLKGIYEKFHKQGFDMVAISVDQEADSELYRKIIGQNQYPWKQILDHNGANALRLDIRKYPSNFLLDREGKIIALDIKPVLLDDFLEKSL